MEQKPEAQAVADLVKALHNPQLMLVGAPDKGAEGSQAHVLLIPDGLEPHSVKHLIDEFRTAPERREGTAKIASLDSFIAYVNRFKDAHTAIFADPDERHPKLVAIIDYHEKGYTGPPRFGVHRVEYEFPLADEWKAWNEKNETTMDQGAFARWVEDRIADVADPAHAGENAIAFASKIGCDFAGASRLLELSKGLAIRVGARVAEHVNLASGETKVRFETTHTDEVGATLKVPGACLLELPVFKLGALYQIPARLRYRAGAGNIMWSFALYRTDRIFAHAINEACEKAAKETGCDLFLGTPEETSTSDDDE